MNRTRQIVEQSSSLEEIDIAQMVECVILDAIDANSSDIQRRIVWDESLVVRFRLNSVLKEFEHLPLELSEKISARLKVMANLVNYETERPQEWHARSTTGEGGVELRLSFFPVIREGVGHSFTRGEKIVIRIFDPKIHAFDIDQLGFDAKTSAVLKNPLSRPTGMLLFTSPTGSGKTTAIYASLCHLVELHGSSISTVASPGGVQPCARFYLSSRVRSLMRQNPQVIHDRRDSRSRNRRHCRPSSPHRPSRHQHHSLRQHRRSLHPHDQHGHRVLPSCLQHSRTAPCPQKLPSLRHALSA